MKKRVLEATAISKNTYYKIQKESGAVLKSGITSLKSPQKIPTKKSINRSVDNFDLYFIKRTLGYVYIINIELPTVQKVYNKMQESGVAFKGSKRMLNRILKQIGLKWQKTTDNRKKWIVEKMD